MARIDCNSSNLFCWSKRCKRAKACSCQVCGELKTINPNLYDACVDACQDVPRPASADSYLCDSVGPEVLFNRYGIIRCGFDPYDTLEGQLYTATEEEKKADKAFEQKIITGLGAFLLILMIVLIWD